MSDLFCNCFDVLTELKESGEANGINCLYTIYKCPRCNKEVYRAFYGDV